MVLARVRWRIELLFKLWQQQGRIDRGRSENPWRILCAVYAKLVAMIILHWILLTAVWMYPDRSLVKAPHTVRRYVAMLANAVTGSIAVVTVIERIGLRLRAGCRIDRRQQRPSTYQLLLALADDA